MKLFTSAFLTLLLVTSLHSASSQNIQLVSSTSSFPVTIIAQNDGLFYTVNSAFNPQNGTVFPSEVSNLCIYDTADLNIYNGQFWCTNTWVQKPVLQLLTPNLTAVAASYTIPKGASLMNNYGFTAKTFNGQYIIMAFTSNSLSTTYLLVFDIESHDFICNGTFPGVQNTQVITGWYNGTNLIYANELSNNVIYNVSDCQGNYFVYTGQPNPGYWIDTFNAFNSSSIYTVTFEGAVLQDMIISGSVQIGAQQNIRSFEKVSDTSFFTVWNAQTPSIYTIDQNLNYVQLQAYQGVQIFPGYTASFIQGSGSLINFNYGGINAVYNLNTQQYSYVSGEYPVIILANNNQVLVSQTGYYVLTQGGVFIVSYQSQGYSATPLYQDQANPGLIYVMFFVSNSGCQLLQINVPASTYQIVIQTSCTVPINRNLVLMDAGQSSPGNYYALYGSTFSNTFQVVTSQSGQLPGFVIFLNAANGIMSASPSQGVAYTMNAYAGNFAGVTYYLANSTIAQAKTMPVSASSSTVCKVSETFFLLVGSGASPVTLQVWDAVNLAVVQTIQASISDTISDCFVIGATQETSSQFSFAILIGAQTIYAVDMNGNVNSTPLLGSFQTGLALSSSSFSVQYYPPSGIVLITSVYAINASEIVEEIA